MYWQTGFPQVGGMYLVELKDGECCVTPWNDGTGKNRDSWGDERGAGWCCLTDSRSTVVRWCKLSDVKAALQAPVADASQDDSLAKEVMRAAEHLFRRGETVDAHKALERLKHASMPIGAFKTAEWRLVAEEALAAHASLPLPREECERICKLSIRKNEDGSYGYTHSGMLPMEDALEAVYQQWPNLRPAQPQVGEEAPVGVTDVAAELKEIMEQLERVEGKQIAIWWKPDVTSPPSSGRYRTWNDGEYWVSNSTKRLRKLFPHLLSVEPVSDSEIAIFTARYFAGYNYSHHEQEQCNGFASALLTHYRIVRA